MTVQSNRLANKKPAVSPVTRNDKRVIVSQADFPHTTLQDAQRVPTGLVNDFGGTQGTPPDVALALNISPTSSSWRWLAGSAVAYGLTDGAADSLN